MKITLNAEESLTIFYDSLCNIYGNGYYNGYGLMFDYKESEYKLSVAKLQNPCIEDVFMQIIKDGFTFGLLDIENEGENNSYITLNDIYEKVQNAPIRNLSNIINENSDCEDDDVILQTVFFGKVIFG